MSIIGMIKIDGMTPLIQVFDMPTSLRWLDTIRMIIRRKVPLETVNMYGGTVFGQAMWSAVNEHTPDHAAIVEALIEAGATVEPGYSQ